MGQSDQYLTDMNLLSIASTLGTQPQDTMRNPSFGNPAFGSATFGNPLLVKRETTNRASQTDRTPSPHKPEKADRYAQTPQKFSSDAQRIKKLEQEKKAL